MLRTFFGRNTSNVAHFLWGQTLVSNSNSNSSSSSNNNDDDEDDDDNGNGGDDAIIDQGREK